MTFYGFRELEKLMQSDDAPAQIDVRLTADSSTCTITDLDGNDHSASSDRIRLAIAESLSRWREARSESSALEFGPFEIRAARATLQLSAYDLAEALGTSYTSVKRWERGVFRMSPSYRALLKRLLREKLGQ